MKNKMMWKLAACFGAALVIFTIVFNGIFLILFRQHTIDLHKKDIERQAVGVAESYTEYSTGKEGWEQIDEQEYLHVLDNLALSDIWIVKKDHALITHGDYRWEDLPEKARRIVDCVLNGSVTFGEDFSNVLNEPTLTVGVPVKVADGDVEAVVLLHSPVDGVDSAVSQALSVMSVSVLVGLGLTAVLSVSLSYGFTKPLGKIEEATERLKKGEYDVKTGVFQKNEIGQLAVAIDELAIRLKDASMESRRLEETRRDFITNVSHELRTPVTVLRGSLEALRDGIVTDPEQVKQYREQMISESMYMERLVNDLLELSKLQNSDFSIEKSLINVCDIISDVTRGMRRIAKQKNIAIVTKLSEAECWIMGDYNRIRQMLVIVLDNSIKFSHAGQSVTVKLVKEGSQAAVISVTDSGIGIQPQDLPYIFDRFHKNNLELNKTGTGLGLAIARQIAKRHDVEIGVESRPGVVTEFSFRLKHIESSPDMQGPLVG